MPGLQTEVTVYSKKSAVLRTVLTIFILLLIAYVTTPIVAKFSNSSEYKEFILRGLNGYVGVGAVRSFVFAFMRFSVSFTFMLLLAFLLHRVLFPKSLRKAMARGVPWPITCAAMIAMTYQCFHVFS